MKNTLKWFLLDKRIVWKHSSKIAYTRSKNFFQPLLFYDCVYYSFVYSHLSYGQGFEYGTVRNYGTVRLSFGKKYGTELRTLFSGKLRYGTKLRYYVFRTVPYLFRTYSFKGKKLVLTLHKLLH